MKAEVVSVLEGLVSCVVSCHDCSALPYGVKAAKENRKINEVVMVQSRFYFSQLVAAYLAGMFAGRV